MGTLHGAFRVAIFEEFMDAFARIPRAQQKKVGKFLRLFREDPTSPSINYESISSFSDPNLRTVRIDQAYRAIVLKPDVGNIYVLLWVDHHDEAMRWAENRKVAIHPETGALQVIPGMTTEAVPTEPAETPGKRVFDHIRDRELLRLGVPGEQLAAVRAVATGAELEALSGVLPPEAFEALYWLSEGESLDEVERAMAVAAVGDVDTADFETALTRDASKRRFVVVEDDETLESMLDAPLEKWRVFLHPSQRTLVERTWNGPVRVLGGAGTGKTVVAMHRAAYLAEKVFAAPGERILFTTFTTNLAADIRSNLERICSTEAMSRIDVVHIDKWVADLLRGAGYRYDVHWWGMSEELEKRWGQAVALASGAQFPPEFFRDEWEMVVQPQGCETWDDYKRASRAGRGVRMSRAQRRDVWPVFEEYRHQLEKRGLREPEDAMRDAAGLLRQGTIKAQVRSVVVDEAQDMSTNAFTLLRALIPDERPNDLFIVGDGHQRIYSKRVVLSRAGVNIRGRGRRLRINYRTTDEIRRFAVALLEGVEYDDLDAGADSTAGYRSLMHGAQPEVRVVPSIEDEVESIAQWLAEVELSRACLVARTNRLADTYAAMLEDRAVPTRRLKGTTPDNRSKPGLRVATMHRVKGLEFDRMVVAGMTQDNLPLKSRLAASHDPTAKHEVEIMERALLYVALTRAKHAALITAPGKLSPWVLSRGGPQQSNPGRMVESR
jgi:superfamily I DNA/RNA helicase